jgi:calcium-dependent protein kinase
MAPEVSAGEISCKSDVWSCGVILFIMLGGRPPFVGKSEGETFSKIARGVFSFNGKEWAGVSKEAKALIQKMLTKDVAKRVTAEEAFNDPWVQNRGREMDNEISVLTLESLAGFRTTSKLQQATLSYIASNLTTCQEINELKKAFVILDENGDGRLSISELKNGFENLRLSCAVDIERIVQQCDMDNNGMIDYSEFITATLDWGKHLTQDMLEMAFKAYDTELCGSIGVEEIKSFLGGDSLYNDVWDQMLIDADKNEDGRIDLTEFKNLMLSAFKIN